MFEFHSVALEIVAVVQTGRTAQQARESRCVHVSFGRDVVFFDQI